MSNQFLKFPEDFLWGTATAAHQVEGYNQNDWTVWEKQNAGRLALQAENRFKHVVPDWKSIESSATDPANYISGESADHYHRFREDIELMSQLGINAYRFSVEWSRIEPQRGQYDESEIEHYHEVIKTCRKHNIEPVVTLWHFTNPVWFAESNGWENHENMEQFLKYVKKLVSACGGQVKYWMTLNEPIVYITDGYLGFEGRPPNVTSIRRAWKVLNNMASAHNQAYRVIHENDPDALVGIPHQGSLAVPYGKNLVNRLFSRVFNYFSDYRLLNKIIDRLDFIGVQYYQRGLIRIKWSLDPNKSVIKTGKLSDMGWEVHPHGLHVLLKELWKRYKKPMIITENGIADSQDKLRADYIKGHLKYIHKAIREGVDVRGYFYWSFLDNQEWEKGFWPRFGLVAVDRETKKRTIRPSAHEYAEIIKNNGFTV